MNIEEAKQKLIELKNYKQTYYGYQWFKVEVCADDETKEVIDTILAELDKKDRIIEEMIKVINASSICDYFIKQNCKHYAGENGKLCDVCIKEYFEKKVEIPEEK